MVDRYLKNLRRPSLLRHAWELEGPLTEKRPNLSQWPITLPSPPPERDWGPAQIVFQTIKVGIKK